MSVIVEVYANDVFVRRATITQKKQIMGADDWFEYFYDVDGLQDFRMGGTVTHFMSDGIEKLVSEVMEDVYVKLQALASE